MTGSVATILILLPIGGAVVVWLLPLTRFATASFALLISLVEVGFWVDAVARFHFSQGLQFEQQTSWFSDLNVSYHVGFYGFSLWLAGLTVVVMACAIGYAFWAGRDRPRAYFGLMLLLTGAVVGVFAAQDLLLFYAFWEGMLIPLYVLIGVWGGAGRLGATLKFVIYTMVGSLLMLASIIVFGLAQGTFDLVDSGKSSSVWIFLGFAAAFAVKAPLFPLHGWLPDAYRESSPEVAAVLSGVVSKAAVYGFLRIAIPKFPDPVVDFRVTILVLATIGLVYGSLMAFRAPDVRGVIAYSSLAQLGLITIGLFANNALGFDGAVLQMVNHGLISAALFLVAGGIERRTTTGTLARLGGMARGRPVLATVLMTTGIIALAVPGSSAFAGEFLILAGVFRQSWVWAAIGAGAIVLAAMYMLRLISAVLHREPGAAVTDAALDLRPAEVGVIVPLVACLLALSVWPAAVSAHSFGQPTVRSSRESDTSTIRVYRTEWSCRLPACIRASYVRPIPRGWRNPPQGITPLPSGSTVMFCFALKGPQGPVGECSFSPSDCGSSKKIVTRGRATVVFCRPARKARLQLKKLCRALERIFHLDRCFGVPYSSEPPLVLGLASDVKRAFPGIARMGPPGLPPGCTKTVTKYGVGGICTYSLRWSSP